MSIWSSMQFTVDEVKPLVYRNTPDNDLIIVALTGQIAGYHGSDLWASGTTEARQLADKLRQAADDLDVLARLMDMDAAAPQLSAVSP